MIEYKVIKIESSFENLGYKLTFQDGWTYVEILHKEETWKMDDRGNKIYNLTILFKKGN